MIKSTELERDCPFCEEGVVLLHFEIQPMERDVGIMSAYAIFDYANPCSECSATPSYDNAQIEAFEYDAIEAAYPEPEWD